MKKITISSLLTAFLLIGASDINEAIAKGNGSGDGAVENKVIHLNKETFKQQVWNFETEKEWKYNGKVPAILDFYADWCGPCKMLAPILEEIQKDYEGKIQIFKIDTDNEKELAAYFGIKSLPTIVFIPLNGEPQAVLGFRPKEYMENIITNVLKVSK